MSDSCFAVLIGNFPILNSATLPLDNQLENCELILVRKRLSLTGLFRYTVPLSRQERFQRTVDDTILDVSPYLQQVPIIIHAICEMGIELEIRLGQRLDPGENIMHCTYFIISSCIIWESI